MQQLRWLETGGAHRCTNTFQQTPMAQQTNEVEELMKGLMAHTRVTCAIVHNRDGVVIRFASKARCHKCYFVAQQSAKWRRTLPFRPLPSSL